VYLVLISAIERLIALHRQGPEQSPSALCINGKLKQMKAEDLGNIHIECTDNKDSTAQTVLRAVYIDL
jgi:hypothetical protein